MNSELRESRHHHGRSQVLQVEKRGRIPLRRPRLEGMEAFDIANVDNKDFSERIVTAPVSPVGHARTYAPSMRQQSRCQPTCRSRLTASMIQITKNNLWHPLYHYAYVSDREEGLILVNTDTLADRDPANNFFDRALTFNPDNALKGAETLTVAGTSVYIGCDRGLVVVDINQPLTPRIIAEVPLSKPRSITCSSVTRSSLMRKDLKSRRHQSCRSQVVGQVAIQGARTGVRCSHLCVCCGGITRHRHR